MQHDHRASYVTDGVWGFRKTQFNQKSGLQEEAAAATDHDRPPRLGDKDSN